MIMAGGVGTRLWPLSRQNRPKQLIPLLSSGDGSRPSSLLELAAGRLDGLIEPKHRYICTSEQYRSVIRETLPQFSDEQILGEPMGRNTVNAIGLTAAVLSLADPKAVFAVLTADHIIEPADVFRERVEVGFRLVEEDPTRLVTFSITPTRPATGYGYVERSGPIEGYADEAGKPTAFRVARFVEKPDRARAEAYFRSGVFGWNSGMFIFSADTFLYCLRRFKPESHAGLMRIREAWATPQRTKVLGEVYPALPNVSVDYAVMEPASRDRSVSICMVEMPVRWLDVGSWPSFGLTLEADSSGNRRAGVGGSLIVDGRDTLVVNTTEGHTVAVLGAEDLIVVHTEDATLVMPREQAERLKELHALVDDSLK